MIDYVFVFTKPGDEQVVMIPEPPISNNKKFRYARLALLIRFFYQILT